MEVTAQVAVQEEAVFMARAPIHAEEVFTVKVILVTKEDIISNPAKVINNNNLVIRATRSS